MMRSLYSGISGLRNHQTRMDVIGNNIANVNTAGYKTSRVIFQDIFSQNVSAGMSNQGEIGGTNPMQIGLGIRLSSVDVIHSRSAFQRTDNATDMMINGDGYFIVMQENPLTGAPEFMYTRAGNFNIDNEGYLVNSLGMYVMGNTFQMVMGIADPGSPAMPAVEGRSPARTYTEGQTVPATMWRAGDTIPAGMFAGQPAGAFTITEADIDLIRTPATPTDTFAWLRGPVETDQTLTLPVVTAVAEQAERPPVIGLVQGPALGLSRIRLTATANDIPRWDQMDEVTRQALRDIAAIADPVAQRAALDTFLAGYEENEVSLPGFSVANNGDVSVILGNRKVVIGRISVAMFANPSGLEKAGDSLYRESASSGPVVITEAYLDGAGKIDGGGLEMSNVDLANEFTDMIVTQRGFQANSRIITVSDTMLEELVNLKR